MQTIFKTALTFLCSLMLTTNAHAKPESSASQTNQTNQPNQPNQMNQGLYRGIIEEALGRTVCSANVKVVYEACEKSDPVLDKKALANGKGDSAPPLTRQVLSLTDRETKKIIDFAGTADSDPEDRARALYHFGQLLRTLQDFYFLSNYLELKIEDSSPGTLDPYNIEPINWSKTSRDPREIAMLGFEYGGIDKNSATETEGAKKLGQATYFSMARELALKETQREWNTIERLIRIRYPQRATEITAAMKSASCPADFKPGTAP